MFEEEIIGHIFKQNCGDFLKVLEKKKQNGKSLYFCEFQKYPYNIWTQKGHIVRGTVLNPQIEQVEFFNKIWSQKCGDSLKILKKSDKKSKNGISLYECEFINYSYKTLAQKSHIIKGEVFNPQIENFVFIGKEFIQNCGDTLRVIRKTNIKQGENFLYECEFIKYFCKVFVLKKHIIQGSVLNPKMPWLDKNNFIKYIQENFNYKPTLQELAFSLKISKCYTNLKIIEFKLENLVNYYLSREENQVREFVKSIYPGTVKQYNGTKEDNYREIDIYLPELKKGIEYNGSFYHEEGNPNNLFSKSIGYHREKQELFAKKGIKILFIWDYEWFEDYPNNKIISEQTKQKIREFL